MLTDFHGDEAKKNVFVFEKNQTGQLKKAEIFNSPNSQVFLAKILEIGPWVSTIN